MLRGRRPLDLELAHVRDVEHAGVRSDRPVLRDHALVLNRHLPAGKRDDACTGRQMPLVERGSAEGLHPAMLTAHPRLAARNLDLHPIDRV